MEFEQLIRERYSVRKYSPAPVEEEKLQMILEAARLAPTGHNSQPQRVYVLESEVALQKMDAIHPCRYGASTVLMVCADKDVALNYKGVSSYEVDATIAATHMLLAAYDAGVDSVWLGVFEPEKVQAEFDLPENIIPICLIDLGFRTDDYAGNPAHSKKNPLENMVTRL